MLARVRAGEVLPSANYVVVRCKSSLDAMLQCVVPEEPTHRKERGPITVNDHDDGFMGPGRVFAISPHIPASFARNKCGVQHDGSPYLGTMFLAVTKLRKQNLAILGALSALRPAPLPKKVGIRRRSGILCTS